MELPHLPAPVGLEDLAGQLVKLPRGADLDLGVDVYLIRGIKNRLDPERGASLSDAKLLDFMRGEETQMMGLLSLYGGGEFTTVVNLASHTKYIVIDPHDRVMGSVTTLSGQVYESLVTNSLISKSIVQGNRDDRIEDPVILHENMEKLQRLPLRWSMITAF